MAFGQRRQYPDFGFWIIAKKARRAGRPEGFDRLNISFVCATADKDKELPKTIFLVHAAELCRHPVQVGVGKGKGGSLRISMADKGLS